MNIRILMIIFVMFIVTPIALCNISDNVTINATTLASKTPITYIGGGSSSSGSGMSVSSDEPFSNIASTYKAERYWYYNVSAVYSLQSDVYEVIVLPTIGQSEVTLSVNILKSRSNVTLPLPDEVYKYFNIYIGSLQYKKLTIKFKVNTSWNHGEVVLQNWKPHDNKWISIPVDVISQDTNFTYYQATVNGLDYPRRFAITRTTLSDVTSVTTNPILEDLQYIPRPTSSPNVTVTKHIPIPVEPSKPLSPWVYVIFVIFVIIGVVVYFNVA